MKYICFVLEWGMQIQSKHGVFGFQTKTDNYTSKGVSEKT